MVFQQLKKNQYAKCTILSLLQLEHLKAHPIGKLLENQAELLLEEPGEISFSQLSHSTLRDTNKSQVEQLSSNYKMIGVWSRFCSENNLSFSKHSSKLDQTDQTEIGNLKTHIKELFTKVLNDQPVALNPTANSKYWVKESPTKILFKQAPLEFQCTVENFHTKLVHSVKLLETPSKPKKKNPP